MIRILFLIISILFIQGCSTFFNQDRNIDILEEKKVQASRKSEITTNGRVVMSVIATHLNEVSQMAYYNREYFFIEIFQEDNHDIPPIDYELNGQEALWFREIKPSEFDRILKPTNKWSRCYLVAFRDINELKSRDMILKARVASQGEMIFDFSFKTLPMQF